jgi:hypothetical protein
MGFFLFSQVFQHIRAPAWPTVAKFWQVEQNLAVDSAPKLPIVRKMSTGSLSLRAKHLRDVSR